MRSRVVVAFEVETEDPEVEKRLINSVEGPIDWEQLTYVLEFVDTMNVTVKIQPIKGKR